MTLYYVSLAKWFSASGELHWQAGADTVVNGISNPETPKYLSQGPKIGLAQDGLFSQGSTYYPVSQIGHKIRFLGPHSLRPARLD